MSVYTSMISSTIACGSREVRRRGGGGGGGGEKGGGRFEEKCGGRGEGRG